jgi:hypothetical protein
MTEAHLEESGGGGAVAAERKKYEETIASASELVDKWKREEAAGVGTSKAATARENRLEAEEVRKEAQSAMSQLGAEERWLVEGTSWAAGWQTGSTPPRRPRPDLLPTRKKTSATVRVAAVLCTFLFIVALIVGMIILRKWYLGHYADIQERNTDEEQEGSSDSTFVPCGGDSSGAVAQCVPRSECSSVAATVTSCLLLR